MTIAVLLADPHAPSRADHIALLAAQPDLKVLGAYAYGREVCAHAQEQAPDVLLTDLQLKDMGGIELMRRLAAHPGLGHIRVVVLAGQTSCPQAFEALQEGARGLLFKDTDTRELPRAVRLVAAGEASVSSRVTQLLIDACVSSPKATTLDDLTPREREVLSLVGTGLSTQEIADRLVVAQTTAKTHVYRAMLKLGARSRTRLVAIAYESGLVSPRHASL
ncbi:response regulator transcription factor [Streptomyces sp. T-3]|nr:response regulator transcription factor [Streptomyces sp. T-3]